MKLCLFLSFILYFLFPCIVLSQNQKNGFLSNEEFSDFKKFMAEKKLEIRDSILIKIIDTRSRNGNES